MGILLGVDRGDFMLALADEQTGLIDIRFSAL
jgi:hypothetical protein